VLGVAVVGRVVLVVGDVLVGDVVVGDVVVGDAGEVVVVVVVPGTVVVVDEDPGTVVVVGEVVVVGKAVVGVVVEGGVVVGEGVNMLPTEVPPLAGLDPRIEEIGFPAMSSKPVTTTSATTKTTPMVKASTDQRILLLLYVVPARPDVERSEPSPSAPEVEEPGPRLIGSRPACRLLAISLLSPSLPVARAAKAGPVAGPVASVGAGVSPFTMGGVILRCGVSTSPAASARSIASAPPATAIAASVAESPAASVTGDSAVALVTVPVASVVPDWRRSEGRLGTLTTCLTTSWVRSIDWTTRAVDVLATALPSATPIIVPFSPNRDAIRAEATAPAADAAICLGLSFIAIEMERASSSLRGRSWDPEADSSTIPAGHRDRPSAPRHAGSDPWAPRPATCW